MQMYKRTLIFAIAILTIIGASAKHRADALQKDSGLEDYGPDSDPNNPSGADGSGDPNLGSEKFADGDAGGAAPAEAEEDDRSKTKFSDERFAKLFPSRGDRRSFLARDIVKPKPTLPSFIKSTPAFQRVQISTTPAPRGNGRLRPSGQSSIGSTTRRPSGPSTAAPRSGRLNGNSGRNGAVTARQLSGRLSTTPAPSRSSATSNGGGANQNTGSASASGPSAAALAAARRHRQGSGISRFQRNQNNNNNNAASSAAASAAYPNNSTIPALNPRRN